MGHFYEQHALLCERRRYIRAALRALVETGVGVCFSRKLAECGREASRLVLLDRLFCDYPPDVRTHVASFVAEIDLDTLYARENTFLFADLTRTSQVAFVARGNCGRNGISCYPTDEHAYLELEHHFNVLLEQRKKDLLRLRALERYAHACENLGLAHRSKLANQLLESYGRWQCSLAKAPPCECEARAIMPRGAFWHLVETEPINATAVRIIELHFTARYAEMNVEENADTTEEYARVLDCEEKRLRIMIKLFPQKFTEAWGDDAINLARDGRHELPIFWNNMESYFFDMSCFVHLQECIDVHLQIEESGMSVTVPLENVGFLRERLGIYGADCKMDCTGSVFICSLYGLDVTNPKDQQKIISFFSNGLCGLKVCLIAGFPLDCETQEASFVHRELKALRIERCIEVIGAS